MTQADHVDYLTVAEVAARLRVSRMTVYRLCAEEEIKSVRIGRSIRIDETSFNAYLNRGNHD